MADKISKERRSDNMRQIRSKNMKPELVVRRLVHGLGYRYRLHRKDLPGKPDLTFGPKRKVIFVHGCFWHQHSDPSCKDGRLPKSRTEYWRPKLKKNVERDEENLRVLHENGWKCLEVWECETKDLQNLSERLVQFLTEGSTP